MHAGATNTQAFLKLEVLITKLFFKHIFLTARQPYYSEVVKAITSHDTIKILQENIGSKILDTSHSSNFANILPRAREIKEKNKQMELHQIKKLLQI